MSFQLIRVPSGFSIEFKGRIILTHTVDSPCLSVGIGIPRVKSFSGFFRIKEARPKMNPLSSFEILEDDSFRGVIRLGNVLTMTIEELEGRLDFRFKAEAPRLNRFRINLKGIRNEKIYGGGEQYARKNLKGSKLPVWISEPGTGRRFDLFTILFAIRTGHIPRWYNTYFSMPTWLTSSGMFCHSHSSAYTELDFRNREKYSLYLWEVPECISLGLETDLKGALCGLTGLLGRQPELPEWLYDGFILGVQGGRTVVDKKLARVKAAGVKLAGLWCQDWEGRRKTSFGHQLRWAWKADETLYPDLSGYIKTLREEGIRFLGYNNTFLTPGSSMFDEALEKGYLIKREDGSLYTVDVPFDPAAMVDFTNPAASLWLKQIIKDNMIDTGLSGWMADFGEMIPHDCVPASGESGLTYHNRYPVDWARLNREAIIEAGREGDIFTFMRAGFSGASHYSCSNWTGDQLVDWSRADGLPSAIMASLTLGLSGIGYVHSDIGGYTTLGWKKRSRELLMRWAEFSAFTQTMRSHEGNRPGNNVQYGDGDSELLAHLARMTRIFSAMKPYHQLLSHEYQEKGLPPMRIMELHYPEQSGAFRKYRYQYLYGEDLLVAPVIKPGKREWKVYLPRDQWIHLWTGMESTGGGLIKVAATPGEPPVFYRKNSYHTQLFSGLRNL